MTRPESTASIAIIYRFQLNRLTQTGTDNPNPQLQLRPGKNGFDIVKHSDTPDAGGAARYAKNVVEAKGGSSPLGTRWAEGRDGKSIRAEQGSRPYFNSVRKEMGGEGKSQQSVNIADDLSTALDDNNVEYWHVKAPLDKDPSQLKSIEVREFDLS
jgi:hypothetical protein